MIRLSRERFIIHIEWHPSAAMHFTTLCHESMDVKEQGTFEAISEVLIKDNPLSARICN
jgi:hypothetical protein